MHNKNSLDTICASLTYAMGIEKPEKAAEKNNDLCGFTDDEDINIVHLYKGYPRTI